MRETSSFVKERAPLNEAHSAFQHHTKRVAISHATTTHKPLLMTTRKEEKRREHKKSNKNVTLWERKNNALRFIEDEDRTLTTVSDWGRSSSVSSVGGTSVQHTNNENEDALEVLANSVNVIFSNTTNKSKSTKDENASY